MLFSILGPVDLRVEDKPIDLGPAKQRAILTALLIDRDRPVPLEVLVDRVWGDTPPADVRNLVYTYIARLRRKLASVCSDEAGDPALKRVVGGYCLQTPPETVDLYVFRHLLERSRQPGGTDAERSALLTQANSMWRGIPLSGIGGRWASAMRHSLQQLRHEALVEWADVEVRLGRPRMVIDPLRQAYVESPLSESIATQLMLALHNDGRSSEALQLFDTVRRHLSTEIGADPGPALREAHNTILQGHATAQPVLAPVPVVPAEPVDTASESGPPDMLPIDLPDFTGRDDHVRLVRDTLTPGAGPLIPSVVVLYGPAGFGKTTIAVHAAYQLRSHFPSGRLYVDLEGNGGSPADPHDVLERLLRALGVPKDEIPARFTERAEMYRGRLARSRTLVVLDNAVDEPQVAPLLPGTGHCGVIVTCRVRPVVPQGVPVIRVDAMPAGESMALLRRLAGDRVDREPDAARELLELCAGSPLLLRVVGNRLMIRPNWSLGRLLTRLRDDDRLLAELTDGRHDVRARIAESYLTIGPATQRFFVELAARPATRWSARAAARALDLSETEAEEHLEQLLDVHLVDAAPGGEPGADIYLLPKLHRLFARSVSAHVRTLPVANLGVVGF